MNTENIKNTVERMNQDQNWLLTPNEVQAYAEVISHLIPTGYSNAQVNPILRNYHADHRLVEALRTSSYPSSQMAWGEITQTVKSIVVMKIENGHIPVSSSDLDDLVQLALVEIFENIHRFGYRSRFLTWVFAIVGNTLTSFYRTQSTKKRAMEPLSLSLEVIGLVEDIPKEEEGLYVRAENEAITKLAMQILIAQPDARLVPIFYLSVFEDRTLREISAQFSLSLGRVHALLQRAIAILRKDPSLLEWFDEVDTPDSMALVS